MNWEEEALVRISAQVHNCEHMLIFLIKNSGADFTAADEKLQKLIEQAHTTTSKLSPRAQPTTNQ